MQVSIGLAVRRAGTRRNHEFTVGCKSTCSCTRCVTRSLDTLVRCYLDEALEPRAMFRSRKNSSRRLAGPFSLAAASSEQCANHEG